MTWNPGTGVLGVEDSIDYELADVVVLQAVEDGGSVPAGAHETRHAQLCEVLGNRWRRLAHVLGKFVDRHLAMRQRPEHLHAGGVGQHPENLDDETGLVVGQPTFATICMHTQIIVNDRRAGNARRLSAAGRPSIGVGPRCVHSRVGRRPPRRRGVGGASAGGAGLARPGIQRCGGD